MTLLPPVNFDPFHGAKEASGGSFAAATKHPPTDAARPQGAADLPRADHPPPQARFLKDFKQ